MATIIIHEDKVPQEFAEHLITHNLELLFAISLKKDNTDNEVDVYSAGVYPSRALINIVDLVLKQLIQEREDYLKDSNIT